MKKIRTPIVLCIYNRTEPLNALLGILKKIKPERVFVIADGPKNDQDKKSVIAARKLIHRTNEWKCKVVKIYARHNMGLRNRIESGLNTVFETVDRAIILEDDCLPDSSFFYYCENLLSWYQKNHRILSVSGDNFTGSKTNMYDYYFSKYFHSWGWATWRRAWELYSLHQLYRAPDVVSQTIDKIFKRKKDRSYWKDVLTLVFAEKIDSWAYRWSYVHFLTNSLSVVPSKNLVENQGFGKNATNTKWLHKRSMRPKSSLNMPLKHPKKIRSSTKNDEQTADAIYATFKNRIVLKMRKIGLAL